MRRFFRSSRARALWLAALFALVCLTPACAALALAAPPDAEPVAEPVAEPLAKSDTESVAEPVAEAEAAPLLRGYDKKQPKGEQYQYVTLGAYKQGENGEVSPLVWRVLSSDGERALLMSEYVLGTHPVHPDYPEYVAFGGEWTRTEAFSFLNGEFLREAFTEAEQALLDGDEPLGRLFYPSANDLKNPAYGFPKSSGPSKTRFGMGTAWALANGLFRYSLRKGGHSPYWTRTQSKTLPSGSNCTKIDGAVGYIRCIVADVGFRPCGYVVLSRAGVAGGNGTLNDPYRLAPLQ